MYTTARPQALRTQCSFDSQSLKEIERSAYSVGQAQWEPAKVSCQVLRISVAISLSEQGLSVRAPRGVQSSIVFLFAYTLHVLHIAGRKVGQDNAGVKNVCMKWNFSLFLIYEKSLSFISFSDAQHICFNHCFHILCVHLGKLHIVLLKREVKKNVMHG